MRYRFPEAHRPQSGFSLVELAMVLFIISLVLGGLLVPLASQLEIKQRTQVAEQLESIREALIGFAIINGRLPCYTIETDPSAAGYGEEASPCNPTGLVADGTRNRVDGILPWKTLGLDQGFDPWGRQRTIDGDQWDGYWRYRVDENFFLNPFSLNTSPATEIDVMMLDTTTSSAGNPLFNPMTAASERPIAIIYSTGPDVTENGLNATYEQTSGNNPEYEGGPASNLDRDGDGDDDQFDDIVIFLTRPLLFSRMVEAGMLP